MIIVKKTIKNENGTYDSAWSLDEAQVNYLLTYAINSLLAEGVLKVQEAEEAADKEFKEFLESIPEEDLGTPQ